MSSSCFETGAELPWRLVFGFVGWESVCAKALVVIRTVSAIASRRFIFSPERKQSGGTKLQQSGTAAQFTELALWHDYVSAES
jgi:hypothetical protein